MQAKSHGEYGHAGAGLGRLEELQGLLVNFRLALHACIERVKQQNVDGRGIWEWREVREDIGGEFGDLFGWPLRSACVLFKKRDGLRLALFVDGEGILLQ